MKFVWLIFLALISGFALIYAEDFFEEFQQNVPKHSKAKSDIPKNPSDTPLGEYRMAGISSDAPGCAEIGREILEEGGSVADAAIPVILCMGVIQSQASGMGGGFLMVYYNATTKYSKAMIARESAPGLAHEDMFEGNPELAARGSLSVAVPGEIKGLWELYNHFGGNLPWARLLQPVIDLCRNGFPVTRNVASVLNSSGHKEAIMAEPSMAEIFVDPETQDVYQEGDIIKREKLAETLEAIAHSPLGGDEFYRGEVARKLVADMEAGWGQPNVKGLISLEDLNNYKVDWVDPIQVDIKGGFKAHAIPPPGSGILLTFILQVLGVYETPQEEVDSDLNHHRITEAYKHAFAKRTYLGDPLNDPEIAETVNELVKNMTSDEYIAEIREKIMDDLTNNTYEYYGAEYYQPEDKGTAHMSIIGPNGDAIAITSTINLSFGARIRSRSTGIILNDEMDDFSAPNITNSFGVPPSPNNFIRPGKRPMSSMVPTIFTDSEGQVRLVIGGAGGTRITTQSTYISIRNLWYNETIKEAIDTPRIHHQLYPMEVEYETGVPNWIVDGLGSRNHSMAHLTGNIAACNGVARNSDGIIMANHDYRKAGSIDGINAMPSPPPPSSANPIMSNLNIIFIISALICLYF